MPQEERCPVKDMDDDDVSRLLPRRRVPWGLVVSLLTVVFATALSVFLYGKMEQKGLSLRGPGHVVLFESGDAWAFFANDGVVAPVAARSVGAFGVQASGRCERIDGWLSHRELVVESATCVEGGLQDAVVARMRMLGLRFGYWPENIVSDGETLDEVLRTVEVYAAFIQPDARAPQLVALFKPLFPDVLPVARNAGLPPPVFISTRRNDLSIVRVTRSELAQLAALPSFVFAGAAVEGGWVVRRLEREAGGEGDLGRLLLAPAEPPWRTRLEERILKLPPTEQAQARPVDE